MENYINLLLEKGYSQEEITVNDKSMHITINGVKTEVQINSRTLKPRRLKIGYGNSAEDLIKLNELAELEFDAENIRLDSKYGLVEIKKTDISSFDRLLEVVDNIDFEVEKPAGSSKVSKKGVLFEGTVFENIKERGASIGGKMAKMVCEASGMDRDEMLPEYYTDSGEIDGVEIDPETEEVISIYECQSGIHKGQYLDELHLNKALGKYLYDSKIIKTVRKVVILAGGYSDEFLNIIRERSKELLNRENPIEIVLLKTVRIEDVISIDVVNFETNS